ncbi:MAG: hypothetical protein OHK0046_44630 [Anaerolineae bacterium]
MIDERTLTQLNSRDPETRKRAIKALAQSADRAALPHLARVYKEDSDPDVRELARKAGSYITKTAPRDDAPAAPAPTKTRVEAPVPKRTVQDDPGDFLTADDMRMPETREMLPAEIRVSQANAERAKGYLDQAMDWHTRGDNEKARQNLQKALKADPRLMYDSYTTSLAASVTRLEGNAAVRVLAPESIQRQSATASIDRHPVQSFLALLMLIAGAALLVGYLLLPWIDLSETPALIEDGTQTTLADSTDEFVIQLEAVRDGLIGFIGEGAYNNLLAASRGLRFTITGLDSTLISLNIRSISEVLGLEALLNALRPLLELPLFGNTLELPDFTLEQPAPGALDFTLPLVPVVAMVGLVLGLALMFQYNLTFWLISLISGLVGLVPVVYFYLSAVNDVVPSDLNLGGLAESNLPSGVELLGLGYWMSVVGAVLMVLLPLLALLLTPSRRDDF